MRDYGPCPVCDLPMTFDDDADVDLHSMPDGADVHAECCPECNDIDEALARRGVPEQYRRPARGLQHDG